MNVVFLIPNPSKSANSFEELFERHKLYMSSTKMVAPTVDVQGTILIGRAVKGLRALESSSLKLIQVDVGHTFIPFFFRVFVVLRKKNIDPNWIVAGDPFLTMLSANFLRLLINRKAKIQCSFHGEISSLRKTSLKGVVKYCLLSFAYKKADLLRFVSKSQMDDVVKNLGCSHQPSIIVPVPISLHETQGRVRNKKRIAFVGRIHAERGIDEWITIGRRFDAENLLIIGDGPLAKKFTNGIPGAFFLGGLSNIEVQRHWVDIGVLLSTAPHESYGLTLREALLHGVPVVSRRNVGSNELHAEFPELISVFSTVDEAEAQIRDFLLPKPSSVMESEFKRFRESFFVKQEKYLEKLALAWINE